MNLHVPFNQEYTVLHLEHKPYFNYFLKAIWQSDAVEADQIVDWFTAKQTRGADVVDEDVANELKALWRRVRCLWWRCSRPRKRVTMRVGMQTRILIECGFIIR